MAAGRAGGPRPKRSILVLIVTAEEPGLLGPTYFAQYPNVPRKTLVANLNFDTLLPLWPLTELLAQGDGESSIGDPARRVAASKGLTLAPAPLRPYARRLGSTGVSTCRSRGSPTHS